jgi:hypothetical protein
MEESFCDTAGQDPLECIPYQTTTNPSPKCLVVEPACHQTWVLLPSLETWALPDIMVVASHLSYLHRKVEEGGGHANHAKVVVVAAVGEVRAVFVVDTEEVALVVAENNLDQRHHRKGDLEVEFPVHCILRIRDRHLAHSWKVERSPPGKKDNA